MDLGSDELAADPMLEVWIAWHLQIIGEAVARISPELKQMHKEIRWRELAEVRHAIVHEYFELDPLELLGVIRQQLPKLHAAVVLMLADPHII